MSSFQSVTRLSSSLRPYFQRASFAASVPRKFSPSNLNVAVGRGQRWFLSHSAYRAANLAVRHFSLLTEQAANWQASPFQHRVFNALGLEKCTDDEMHDLFVGLRSDTTDSADDSAAGSSAQEQGEHALGVEVRKQDVSVRFHQVLHDTVPAEDIDAFVEEFWEYETIAIRQRNGALQEEVSSLSEAEFISRLRDLGQKIDSRMYPMAAIFGASGISIGIIIPVMPQLAHILDLSTAQ